MNYIEISIETPESELDARCDELCALGCSGVIIENENDFKNFLENNRQYWDYVDDELRRSYTGVSRLKCYITDDDEGAALLTLIRQRYAVTTRPVADSDWENNWRAYYKPIPVGERLLVVPEWESAEEDGRCVLRLDPGLMFGSGSHPTTKMCLAALQDYVPGARTVLDLGCGSGILGIGALVLGAESCVGCDIDPACTELSCENAQKAGVASLVSFGTRDALSLKLDAMHGVLFANPPYGERLLDRQTAEQIYTGSGRGEEKKAYVLNWLAEQKKD